MKNRMLFIALLLVGVVALAGQTATAETLNFGSLDKFEGPSDLDLSGTFLYAVNCTPDSVTRTVSGLPFTPHVTTSGITVTSTGVSNNWCTRPTFGTSTDDDNLEEIMWDTKCGNSSGRNVAIDATVTLGQQYKLQLLFTENYFGDIGSRPFDLSIKGSLAVDEFDILNTSGAWDGWPESQTAGTVYTHTFTAGDTNLDIDLTSATDSTLIGGMTLEEVPEPGSVVLLLSGLLAMALVAWRRR